MRINNLNVGNTIGHLPNFGNACATAQKPGFTKTEKMAKKALGIDNGISLLKIDSGATPSSKNEDTGVGKLDSASADKFLDFMTFYTGANAVKVFPSGQVTKQRTGYFGAYNRSALTLGDDKINPFKLTSEQYGSLLSTDEIMPIVNSHTGPTRLIDYQNELGLSDMNETPVAKGSLPDDYYQTWKTDEKQEILTKFKNNPSRQKGIYYIAWERFKELDENHPLKQEYDEFYSNKSVVDYDDMYTRLALAPFLKSGGVPYINNEDNIGENEIWGDGYHFFEKFDVNPNSLSLEDRRQYYIKKEKYEVMKQEYKDEIDYFKFRQFIAHKQLKETKERKNQNGIDLFGDCLVGFSHWEQQVYPDAFLKGAGGRMGLPVLNCFELTNPNSPAHKLFKQKVKYYLDNYDGVRFDVGWSYINYVYQIDNQDRFEWLGNSLTDEIAKWAKEIKGENYDLRKLMYEFDNNGELRPFHLEYQGNPEQTPVRPSDDLQNLKGTAIFTTEHEHNNVNINGKGWMNSYFLQKGVHLDRNKYILGTCNHDGTPLWILASAPDTEYQITREKNKGALMRVYNNYNNDNYNTPENFSKAKLGELFTTENQFLFYMDVLGKNERVDSHRDKKGWGENDYGLEDYRKRLDRDYEAEYHRAVQEGRGFNLMDALARAMEAKDNNSNGEFLRNETNKNIYNEVRAYAAFLEDSEDGIFTEEQANELYGNTPNIPDKYKQDYTNNRLLK